MTEQDLEAALGMGTKKGTNGVRMVSQNRVGSVRGGRTEARGSGMQNKLKAQLADTEGTPASPMNMMMDVTRAGQIKSLGIRVKNVARQVPRAPHVLRDLNYRQPGFTPPVTPRTRQMPCGKCHRMPESRWMRDTVNFHRTSMINPVPWTPTPSGAPAATSQIQDSNRSKHTALTAPQPPLTARLPSRTQIGPDGINAHRSRVLHRSMIQPTASTARGDRPFIERGITSPAVRAMTGTGCMLRETQRMPAPAPTVLGRRFDQASRTLDVAQPRPYSTANQLHCGQNSDTSRSSFLAVPVTPPVQNQVGRRWAGGWVT